MVGGESSPSASPLTRAMVWRARMAPTSGVGGESSPSASPLTRGVTTNTRRPAVLMWIAKKRLTAALPIRVLAGSGRTRQYIGRNGREGKIITEKAREIA